MINNKVKSLEISFQNADDDLGFLRTYAYDIYHLCYEVDLAASKYRKLPLGLKQVYELAIRIAWWRCDVKAEKFVYYLQWLIDNGYDTNDASLTAFGSNTIYYIKRKLCNRMCETHFHLCDVGIEPTSYRGNNKN